jgi:hypothetical protein
MRIDGLHVIARERRNPLALRVMPPDVVGLINAYAPPAAAAPAQGRQAMRYPNADLQTAEALDAAREPPLPVQLRGIEGMEALAEQIQERDRNDLAAERERRRLRRRVQQLRQEYLDAHQAQVDLLQWREDHYVPQADVDAARRRVRQAREARQRAQARLDQIEAL